jgi:DNA-binding LytR/AlgR family response regulator
MTHKMPVVRKQPEGTHELFWLNIESIVKIEIDKRNVVFHTLDEVYYPLSTLSDYEEHFFKYGFDLLDKSNLVNMELVQKVDPEYGKVFFEKEPNSDSKYAHIAAIQQKLRGHEIQRKIAQNTNASQEQHLSFQKEPGLKVSSKKLSTS